MKKELGKLYQEFKRRVRGKTLDIRVIKWTSYCETKGTHLILGNILFSLCQYKGLQFSLIGFGLNKFQREIFNRKLFSCNRRWTL